MKEYCSLCTGEIYEEDAPIEFVNLVGLKEKAHYYCAADMGHELMRVINEDNEITDQVQQYEREEAIARGEIECESVNMEVAPDMKTVFRLELSGEMLDKLMEWSMQANAPISELIIEVLRERLRRVNDEWSY